MESLKLHLCLILIKPLCFHQFPTLILWAFASLRKQEDLVQNVRRRLEEALTADMMAHIKDTAADAAASKAEPVEQMDTEEL